MSEPVTGPSAPFPKNPLFTMFSRISLWAGRAVLWFENLFRTDDQKIQAVVARALAMPTEREWALEHIVSCVHQCKKPYTEDLRRFIFDVQPFSSQEKNAQFLALRYRILFTNPEAKEDTLLQELSADIQTAKGKWGGNFSSKVFGEELSRLVPKGEPLLIAYISSLQKDNPKDFDTAVGEALLDRIKTGTEPESLKPFVNQKVITSLCTSLNLVPPAIDKLPSFLNKEALTKCLRRYLSLQRLATALNTEEKVDTALQLCINKVQKDAVVQKMAVYCAPDTTVITENLQESLEVLRGLPKSLQISLLIDLRNALQKKNYEGNYSKDFNDLEKVVFDYSWTQTRDEVEKQLISRQQSHSTS
jgi:hypothetical protein